MAFFPCIYFTGSTNPCYYTLENQNYKNLTDSQKFNAMIERAMNRNNFYILLYKLCGVCIIKEFRLIIENPFSTLHFLHNNFLKEPDIIDHDRTLRGDYFRKPTGYWFFNAIPKILYAYQKDKKIKTIRSAKSAIKAGLCSEERSMISPDYARNFICDFILGKPQNNTQLTLF